MDGDIEKLQHEVRRLRRMVAHLIAEVSALKPFIAACGGAKFEPEEVQRMLEAADKYADQLKAKLSEFDTDMDD